MSIYRYIDNNRRIIRVFYGYDMAMGLVGHGYNGKATLHEIAASLQKMQAAFNMKNVRLRDIDLDIPGSTLRWSLFIFSVYRP